MTFSPDQGSRAFLADNERLDKPDFVAATAQFNQELVARALGLLMGGTSPFGGCVTLPSTSWDGGTKFLSINGAVFYQGGTVDSPSGARAGRVIAYDPTKPWQVSLTGIDLTAMEAGSTPCIIWATRTDTANGGPLSSTDTRKRWQPGASAESTFATSTRTQDVIGGFVAVSATFNGSGEWTAGGAPPSDDYFPVLKIASWSAGAPVVTPISAFDGTQNRVFVGKITTNVQSMNVPGLGTIMATVRGALAALLDNTLATNWINAALGTYRGVKQLDTDLAVVESKTGMGVGMAARAYKSGGSWLLSVPSGYAATINRASAGVFNITLTTYPPWAFFNTCLVQPIYAAAPGTARNFRTKQASAYVFNVVVYDSSMLAVDPDDEGFYFLITGHG